MRAVRQIDQAIKDLYHIETQLCAEDFLLFHFPLSLKQGVPSKSLQGALYVRNSHPNHQEPEVDLGIYLSPPVREELTTFNDWGKHWTTAQLNAFCVACEEISHFHYLIFNLERNRPVSEFELELQGEIDKFLLVFFAHYSDGRSEIERFEQIFIQLFEEFRLSPGLSELQKQRYLDASQYAKQFFRKFKEHLIDERRRLNFFSKTRQFYQMDLARKIEFLNSSNR
jgi:hypothetical protein